MNVFIWPICILTYIYVGNTDWPNEDICLKNCFNCFSVLVFRIYLSHLNSLDDAVRIVKESHSIEGAKMVAKYVRIIVTLNYLERVNG